MRGRTLLIAGLLTAAFAGQAAAQSVGSATSPHNLSASGPTAGNTGDNGEICVYCHTPHGSSTLVEAPLWNKPIVAQTYTTYDSTTIDGTILAVGSVSLACLTCHDGTQALDAVINAPGSGLGGGNLGDGVTTMSAGAPNLGLDLSNDHPIGIQYGGWDSGTGVIDADIKPLGAGGLVDISGTNVGPWYVDENSNGTRDKTDMILYTRGGEPNVECASCHDPHQANGTASEVNFLRISNSGSAVCLACHTK